MSLQVGDSNREVNTMYTFKASSNIRFSKAEIINSLHNLDKNKGSYEPWIKPKSG